MKNKLKQHEIINIIGSFAVNELAEAAAFYDVLNCDCIGGKGRRFI